MTYANPTAYELSMGRWSTRLAPLFIRFAGGQDGQRILDAGCGTGSLSRTLLASGEAISVVGVDPTEHYLAFARQGASDSRAKFLVAAAESLPFSNESFDAALALLVVQDMADPGRAAREMAQTTRRGGPVAACLWDFREAMPMISLFWQAAEAVAPEAVARRRAERPPRWLGLQTLAELCTDAGLTAVRATPLELCQEFSSFADFWLPFVGGSTPTCEFAIAVNQETRGELANALHAVDAEVQWGVAVIGDDNAVEPVRADACGSYVIGDLRLGRPLAIAPAQRLRGGAGEHVVEALTD